MNMNKAHSIHEKVDWSCLNEAWAHKRCKGNVFKETYMTNQTLASDTIYDESISSSTSHVDILHTPDLSPTSKA